MKTDQHPKGFFLLGALALLSSSCTLLAAGLSGRCPNGVVEEGEACDDGNALSGDGCDPFCQLEVNSVCGNDLLEDGEECDGDNLDGQSCVTLGFDEGDLACDASCAFDTSGCRDFLCGDGQTEGEEECDDGNNVPGDGCEPNCTLLCGNGSGAAGATLDSATGSCYLGFKTQLDWLASEALCESLGGYLAVIDSEEENQLARRALPSSNAAWIGFHDLDQEAGTDPFGFKKVTGGPLTFHFFNSGEPSNNTALSAEGEDCVQFFPNAALTWNDLFCDATSFQGDIHLICELEPNACGDRVVQTALGEECDDGNNTDGDGCESDCTLICGDDTGATKAALDPDTGNCYLGFAKRSNWFDARASCESLGGYLVVIESDQESALALQAFVPGGAAWIGIHDLDQEAFTDPFGFKKVTGGNITFHLFGVGEPNNSFFGSEEDCAIIQPNQEIWLDFPCDRADFFESPSFFICEQEPNPCGDGVLQTAVGEACDDGNNADGDGCSALCLLE